MGMTWIERIADQRILVTGARGFLGSNVCRRLHEAGIEMHAAGRTLPSETLKLCTWHQADLTDANAAQALLRNVQPDIIIHLAGYAEGSRELQHVLPSFHGDLAATVNVLTAAAELGHARVVFPGSMEEPAPDRPHDVPSSPYAAAKWAAGAYARMFYALYQTPVVMLRVFMAYGPGQRDMKIIPYTILSLLNGESPRLTSGRRPVDWIYVDDVVDGLLTASVASGVEGAHSRLGVRRPGSHSRCGRADRATDWRARASRFWSPARSAHGTGASGRPRHDFSPARLAPDDNITGRPAPNDRVVRREVVAGVWSIGCLSPMNVETAVNADSVVIFIPLLSYFSPYSGSWLKHCKGYADMIVDRLSLNKRRTC